MEATQTRRYITPTLQANWNLAIGDVIRCLNAGLIYEAWLALETLYNILPPDIYKKVVNDYQTIKKDFDSHGTDSASYEIIVESYDSGLATLREAVRPFFRKMYELLYEGGYLEKKAREIDTNAPQELLEQ